VLTPLKDGIIDGGHGLTGILVAGVNMLAKKSATLFFSAATEVL
jgi:hypothetical protein